jgi:NAD(P)-dependent dehydrogenase (short-subunit alcohol dehydrogenase family)
VPKGIGKAFVADNYDLIATDLIDAALKLGHVVSMQSDLERIAIDESYANEFKEQVDNITGESGLSALINNAAVQILGATKELTRSQWQTSFNVNFTRPSFYHSYF